MAERDKLQATAKQLDTCQNPLRKQNKELETQLADMRASHQKELVILVKRKDAELASADEMRKSHQQEADAMARQAETALQKRDRSQEKGSTLQSNVQAFTQEPRGPDSSRHV